KIRERLQTWESQVLAGISSGERLHSTLGAIASGIEEFIPGARVSVLLVEGDGQRLRDGVGPSLPRAFRDAVDGIAIGEGVGSCGTAAHRAAPVYVTDIAKDPLWEAFRALASAHDIAAC